MTDRIFTIKAWSRIVYLENKTWSINNSEIRTMGIFSSHHNRLRRDCSFSLLQQCFSSWLNGIRNGCWQNNWVAIFLRILLLQLLSQFSITDTRQTTEIVLCKHGMYIVSKFHYLQISWMNYNCTKCYSSTSSVL